VTAPAPSGTIVYQSFRTHDVPPWIEACMDSVRAWTRARGYEYRFIDDALFDAVPTWFRDKVQSQVHLVSDLARLTLARDYLAQGYDRALWVDADVVVFDPDALALDPGIAYAFCREDFLALRDRDAFENRRKVCNAVSLYTRGNPFLEFYIHACEEIVRGGERFKHTAIGTDFLSALHQQWRLPLLPGVNLFSPFLLHALATGAEPVLRFWMRQVGAPLAAANLCTTFRNKSFGPVYLGDAAFERVIATLLDTRGAVLNRLLE
jgi:hypothetical protein